MMTKAERTINRVGLAAAWRSLLAHTDPNTGSPRWRAALCWESPGNIDKVVSVSHNTASLHALLVRHTLRPVR